MLPLCLLTLCLLGSLALAACADDQAGEVAAASTSAPAATPSPAPQATAPNRTAAAQPVEPGTQTADAGGAAPMLGNDPSAPPDTPLCGTAARESDALSAQLLSRQLAEASQCSAFACYDAATATYVGADGFRHVCR